jgi:hypothetical protein
MAAASAASEPVLLATAVAACGPWSQSFVHILLTCYWLFAGKQHCYVEIQLGSNISRSRTSKGA